MRSMNWYKILINDESKDGDILVGCSPDTMAQLLEKAARGEYLRFDGILYHDAGEIKTWSQWDNREAPIVYINPANMTGIQRFKGDPRKLCR